jgi:hypothetical protein
LFAFNPGLHITGYLKVKSCQEMAEYLKITNYKLQITNKNQIAMSKITNSPIGLKKTLRTLRRRRLNLSEGHPMFVICIL